MNCVSTTTCSPCNQTASCGCTNCNCPNGVVDTTCVQYTGDDLDNLDVEAGDYLNDILEKLNDVVFSQTNFIANSTDSIIGVTGGTAGHSPVFTVRIDPDENNVLTVTSLGLMVDASDTGDGKVKVDSTDEKDYLKNQFSPGSDLNSIVTITPTTINGVIYMTPTISIVNLIAYIKENYSELLCSIVNECVPEEETTTTTSTSTTSTTSTSTTTTTTTTIGPTDFDISNNSGIVVPFSVFLTDQDSLIDYVVDNTTGNGQFAHYTYNGTTSLSKITIQHSPTVNVGIQIFVNGIEVYDQTDSAGSVVIEDVEAQSDILINFTTPTTTTTTTSTSTSSTSSTSTTSTSSTTTTSTSSTTTTTTTVAQSYYFADVYQCGTCINTSDNVLVSLPTSFTPTIAKFYVPAVDNGSVYFLANTTPQAPGVAVALTIANFTTCGAACA